MPARQGHFMEEHSPRGKPLNACYSLILEEALEAFNGREEKAKAHRLQGLVFRSRDWRRGNVGGIDFFTAAIPGRLICAV
jgi:hypothetical protein